MVAVAIQSRAQIMGTRCMMIATALVVIVGLQATAAMADETAPNKPPVKVEKPPDITPIEQTLDKLDKQKVDSVIIDRCLRPIPPKDCNVTE